MNYREQLRSIGERILEETRTELYLGMHFMGPALGSLSLVMDLSTTSIGTDASYIRFNSKCLMTQYIEDPYWLRRVYLHMVLHCIFRHMYGGRQREDAELWNLCCDIAVESVIDSMDIPVITRTLSEKRSACYERLKAQVGTLSAQRLYHSFMSKERDYPEEAYLEQEFAMDDHSFWERMEDDCNKDPQQLPEMASSSMPLIATKRLSEEEWRRLANKVRLELTMGKEARQDRRVHTFSDRRLLQKDGLS